MHKKLISGKISIQYCASEDNLADLLMKALPKPKHQDLTACLGMTSELRGSIGKNAKYGNSSILTPDA